MKLAIISDIHGNAIAFEAVLADLQTETLDGMVCLGDAIQGGPQPAETVQRLRDLACPVVMGNADKFLLTGTHGVETVTEAQLEVRAWSLAQLAPADVAFIEGFAPTVERVLEAGVRLCAFHGTPRSFNEILLPATPDDEVRQMLGDDPATIWCGGHTHMQQIRRIGDYFFFNPGSVGLAWNHDQPEESFRINPWAEYAILEVTGGRVRLDLRRVPYAVDTLLAVYESSGRPQAGPIIEQWRRGLRR
jgi:predicted phosphodiesterase